MSFGYRQRRSGQLPVSIVALLGRRQPSADDTIQLRENEEPLSVELGSVIRCLHLTQDDRMEEGGIECRTFGADTGCPQVIAINVQILSAFQRQ